MHQIVIVSGWADTGVKLVPRLTATAVPAGLGVFSAVLILAGKRVHDLGVSKGPGVTPQQIISMVTCWAIAPAIAALPAAIALEGAVAQAVVSSRPACCPRPSLTWRRLAPLSRRHAHPGLPPQLAQLGTHLAYVAKDPSGQDECLWEGSPPMPNA
jgi:hypothetical protein